MATLAALKEQLRRALRDESGTVYSDDLLVDAINTAIESAWPLWYDVHEDTTTVTIAANTFRYTLPSDVEYLAQVWLEQSSSEPYIPLRDCRWAAETSSTGSITKYLYLDKSANYETGKAVRLIYESQPQTLSASTDATSVPTPYVIPRACAYIFQRDMIEGPGKDTDHLKNMVALNLELADDYLQKARRNHITGHVHYSTSEGGWDIYAQRGIIDKHRPSD